MTDYKKMLKELQDTQFYGGGSLGLCTDRDKAAVFIQRNRKELEEVIQAAQSYTAQLDGLMGIIESQKQTYDVLIKMVRERDAAVIKLIDNIICECESQMSNAEHRKKVAGMDYHTSEIQHQEGRWHCANDLRKWAETHKATIEAAGLGYEN
jgi:hypothetical protein